MKTYIFPGSFDPFHKGHINVVKTIVENKIGNLVLLLQHNRFKNSPMFSTEFKLNLMKEMVKEFDNVDIEYSEKLSFYDYWVDGNKDKSLIIGDDVLSDFYKWTNVDLMLQEGLEIIVVERNSVDKEYYSKLYPIVRWVKPEIEFSEYISSTNIRKRIMEIIRK